MRTNKGPRIELNPAGLYEVRWTINGRSKRLSTKTADMQEAQRFLASWILDTRKSPASVDTKSILTSYREEHVEEQVIDKRRIDDCFRPLYAEFGDLMPQELTCDRVAKYKVNRKNGTHGRAVTDSTIRRELVALKAALNHAVKQKRVNPSDVPAISLPPEAPSRDFWLNEAEEHAFVLLAAQTSVIRLSRIHRFVVLALETAARRKSIETLRWEQVDLLAGVIRFDKDGKRIKKKRRVAVPISDRLRPILERAYQERTSEFVLDTPYSVQHHFEALTARASQRIGLKFTNLTIHDLRRTWATLAARAGVNLFQIAGVLGDTVTTVEKAYAHHCPDHLRGAVNFRKVDSPNQFLEPSVGLALAVASATLAR